MKRLIERDVQKREKARKDIESNQERKKEIGRGRKRQRYRPYHQVDQLRLPFFKLMNRREQMDNNSSNDNSDNTFQILTKNF